MRDRAQEERAKRAVLFTPCETKEALGRWIHLFLGYELPGCIVDPESTSSPLDIVWELYQIERQGGDPDKSRVLFYAARDAYKTLSLSASIVLALFHNERDVGHMAAIQKQAAKCASYIKAAFARAPFRDFIVGDNLREIVVVRYKDDETGEYLSPKEYDAKPEAARAPYREIRTALEIVIATMQGANSSHVLRFNVDELDVLRDKQAYEESKMIPSPRDGILPLTTITSSRKFAIGLVQKEIDDAEKTGLVIRHWNLLDVTERCRPDRHKPELPRLKLYVDDDMLHVVDRDTLEKMEETKRERYVERDAFTGCVSCRLFPSCQTNLATRQTSTSKLLKPIPHVIQQFRNVSLPTALAQLLSRKPSKEGLIYPRFDPDRHVVSATEMWRMITGVDPGRPITKDELVQRLIQSGAEFYAGQDYGTTHNFATVVAAKWGALCLVLECASASGLDPGQKVAFCDSRVKRYGAAIFGDPEDPGMIALMRRMGYSMRELHKGPGSVKTGIDSVSYMLWPSIGDPRLFFLAQDEGVALLVDNLQAYHYKLDAAGEPTEEPDEEGDDEPDALRYLIMGAFGKQSKLRMAVGADPAIKAQELVPVLSPFGAANGRPEAWMQALVQKHTAGAGGRAAGGTGRKGGLKWAT